MNGNKNSALETRIQELTKEIENYEQAIRDAEGALDAAEKELTEALAAWDAEKRS